MGAERNQSKRLTPILDIGFGPISDFGKGFGQMLNEPNLANKDIYHR